MIYEIRSCANGYIVYFDGQEHVAKTLLEAATIVGERTMDKQYCEIESLGDLIDVRAAALQGRKIDAIKLLRSITNPTLSLKAAKDIVEVLVLGGHD